MMNHGANLIVLYVALWTDEIKTVDSTPFYQGVIIITWVMFSIYVLSLYCHIGCGNSTLL